MYKEGHKLKYKMYTLLNLYIYNIFTVIPFNRLPATEMLDS